MHSHLTSFTSLGLRMRTYKTRQILVQYSIKIQQRYFTDTRHTVHLYTKIFYMCCYLMHKMYKSFRKISNPTKSCEI